MATMTKPHEQRARFYRAWNRWRTKAIGRPMTKGQLRKAWRLNLQPTDEV